MENVESKKAVPDLLRKAVIHYRKKKEKTNPHRIVRMYILQNLLIKIYLIVLTFENTSNNNYAVTVGIEYKGSKSCCFYCDDVAKERDMNTFIPKGWLNIFIWLY